MLKNNIRTSVIVPATAETAWWMCYLRLPSVQGAVAVGGTAVAGGDTGDDVRRPPHAKKAKLASRQKVIRVCESVHSILLRREGCAFNLFQRTAHSHCTAAAAIILS